MNLSPHFTLAELTVSDTAARKGIDNQPNSEITNNLIILANTLEKVRALLGHPIHVTSGYRSSTLNKAIGGSKTSKHMQGLAADMSCHDFGTVLDVCNAIKNSDLMFDQCILEYYNPDTGSGWCHFGIGGERRQCLTINTSGTFNGFHV